MNKTELRSTPLNPLHIEQNAQIVPFAGSEMPVQYTQEHLHTRKHPSLLVNMRM